MKGRPGQTVSCTKPRRERNYSQKKEGLVKKKEGVGQKTLVVEEGEHRCHG